VPLAVDGAAHRPVGATLNALVSDLQLPSIDLGKLPFCH
jgi:hypothetical protein